MQSKNILWIGVLFIILLTTFCIAKYIDGFHPSIQTVTVPNQEIIDQDFTLQPVEITQTEDFNYSEEVDENYLKVIQLIEQEERDIEDAYNKALVQEVHKSNHTPTVKAPIQVKIIQKPVQKKLVTKKEKTAYKKPKKLSIETIVANQTLLGFGKLSHIEKEKLKEIVRNFKENPSSYLRIESDQKNNKFYSTKRYLNKLGILKEDIQVLEKKYKNAISITHSNHSDIEILVIKKD